MGENRLFLSQAALDAWLSEGRVDVEGEVLVTKPEGQRFKLTTAVRFKAEVTGEGDPKGLVGKVKDLSQLGEMEAEHYADSVIVGDHAYEVVEGFAGAPLAERVDAQGTTLASAAQAALGERRESDDADLLAQFLSRGSGTK